MKDFNIQRFTQVIVNQIITERRSYITYIGGMIIAYFLCAFIAMNIEYTLFNDGFEDAHQGLGAGYTEIYVFLLIFSIGLSLTFSNLYTKQQRIAFIMLPATFKEKYFARILIYTIGSIVASLACLCIGDLASVLATSALHSEWVHSGIPCFFSNIVGTCSGAKFGNSPSPMQNAIIALFFIATNIQGIGYQLLCSSIFRRWALINGWVIAIALFIGISIVVGFSFTITVDNINTNGTFYPTETAINTAAIVFASGLIITGIIGAYFSYYNMKRLQVI